MASDAQHHHDPPVAILAAAYAKLPASPLTIAAVAAIVYFLGRAVYRLFFHPLAKFPGPRLAAVTTFYEGYYEIICNGQYGRKISQLHDKYGTSSPFPFNSLFSLPVPNPQSSFLVFLTQHCTTCHVLSCPISEHK